MAKIVDPDQLNQATEVVISTAAKTVQLLVAGNLNDTAPGSTSGVTHQALYSFLKEEWQSDASLNKFRFPIKAIFNASFIWQNGWALADVQSEDLIRDGGWQDADGGEHAIIISLGAMDDSGADLGYYTQASGFTETTVAFDKTGEVNEHIVTKGTGGTPDDSGYAKFYLREEGKTYASYDLLAEQGFAALDYIAYRVPLANAIDIDVNETDTNIDSQAPYTLMELSFVKGAGFTQAAVTSYSIGDVIRDTAGRWAYCTAAGTLDAAGVADYTNNGGTSTFEAFAGERQIGSTYYAFNRILDANAATRYEMYEWAQRQLRQTGDINDDLIGSPNQDAFGVVNGAVASDLLYFVGPTLHTEGGVFIDNFDVNETNSIVHHDITVDGGGLDTESVPVTTTARPYPFIAAGTMEFSSNLVAELDAETIYTMYFLNDDAGDNAGADFDTATAIIVKDNSATDITGEVSAASIVFDYDYDGNVQRGAASAGLNAPVVVVAMALDGAEWVEANATITAATGLTIPVNAADERNYLNP